MKTSLYNKTEKNSFGSLDFDTDRHYMSHTSVKMYISISKTFHRKINKFYFFLSREQVLKYKVSLYYFLIIINACFLFYFGNMKYSFNSNDK